MTPTFAHTGLRFSDPIIEAFNLSAPVVISIIDRIIKQSKADGMKTQDLKRLFGSIHGDDVFKNGLLANAELLSRTNLSDEFIAAYLLCKAVEKDLSIMRKISSDLVAEKVIALHSMETEYDPIFETFPDSYTDGLQAAFKQASKKGKEHAREYSAFNKLAVQSCLKSSQNNSDIILSPRGLAYLDMARAMQDVLPNNGDAVDKALDKAITDFQAQLDLP